MFQMKDKEGVGVIMRKVVYVQRVFQKFPTKVMNFLHGLAAVRMHVVVQDDNVK